MAYFVINHECYFLMFSFVLFLLTGEAIGDHYRHEKRDRDVIVFFPFRWCCFLDKKSNIIWQRVVGTLVFMIPMKVILAAIYRM